MPETVDSAREATNHAVRLAAAGWLDVLDDIHGGLCHDFNGRVSAVEGLLEILRLDGPAATEVVGFIGGEADRLARTVALLRTLSGKVGGDREPLMAGDVVDTAVRLHSRHRGLEMVETATRIADGIPPFRASSARTLRVLLIVLSHAGRDAREAGVGRISLEASSVGGTEVSLRVSWDRAAPSWPAAGLVSVAVPLGELLAAEGARLQVGGGGVTLTWPAMVRGGG